MPLLVPLVTMPYYYIVKNIWLLLTKNYEYINDQFQEVGETPYPLQWPPHPCLQCIVL